MRVISPWGFIRMVRSCCCPGFSSLAVRLSGPNVFAFSIAFIAKATSPSVGSVPGAVAVGYCGSLFVISGLSISYFAFSSERKNRTHLSRVDILSRSSLGHGCNLVQRSTSFPADLI